MTGAGAVTLAPAGPGLFYPGIVNHYLDSTGGQSGSAIMQTVFGGSSRYLTAIHVGAPSIYSTFNQARRFDSAVYGFLKSYTSY
jgi:hypothetical protein